MKKILIVEDDSSLVKGLCKALSSEKIDTVEESYIKILPNSGKGSVFSVFLPQ